MVGAVWVEVGDCDRLTVVVGMCDEVGDGGWLTVVGAAWGDGGFWV